VPVIIAVIRLHKYFMIFFSTFDSSINHVTCNREVEEGTEKGLRSDKIEMRAWKVCFLFYLFLCLEDEAFLR
jgi:hypothetical protein